MLNREITSSFPQQRQPDQQSYRLCRLSLVFAQYNTGSYQNSSAEYRDDNGTLGYCKEIIHHRCVFLRLACVCAQHINTMKILVQKQAKAERNTCCDKEYSNDTSGNHFKLSSTATATLTVIPTMGLLPAPRKPIISTCAGTEEEPANWASPCIRPMVSVKP